MQVSYYKHKNGDNMGKQYLTSCSVCGRKHFFPANSNKNQIKCDGIREVNRMGNISFVPCKNIIINKGYCKETHPQKPRLKISDMKTGKQKDLMGGKL